MITKSSVAHASLVMSLGRNNTSQRTLARPTKLEDHLGTEYLLAFFVTAIFQVLVFFCAVFFFAPVENIHFHMRRSWFWGKWTKRKTWNLETW